MSRDKKSGCDGEKFQRAKKKRKPDQKGSSHTGVSSLVCGFCSI